MTAPYDGTAGSATPFLSELRAGQIHPRRWGCLKLSRSCWHPTPVSRTFAPIVVPQGEYFMMGDSRDDSFDSRFWGTVKRETIVGRATAVVLSLDKSNYWLPRWKRTFSSLRSE